MDGEGEKVDGKEREGGDCHSLFPSLSLLLPFSTFEFRQLYYAPFLPPIVGLPSESICGGKHFRGNVFHRNSELESGNRMRFAAFRRKRLTGKVYTPTKHVFTYTAHSLFVVELGCRVVRGTA